VKAQYMFSAATANLIFKRAGFDSKVLGLQNSNNYKNYVDPLAQVLNLKAKPNL